MEEQNHFGIFDRALPIRRKSSGEITLDELEIQLDEGAFLMDYEEAVKLGFIHPDYESDTIITGIRGEA